MNLPAAVLKQAEPAAGNYVFTIPFYLCTVYTGLVKGGLAMLGHGELVVIVLVILVLFGAAAIPKFARSLGQAKKEFTKAMKEGEDEKAIEEKDEKKPE